MIVNLKHESKLYNDFQDRQWIMATKRGKCRLATIGINKKRTSI